MTANDTNTCTVWIGDRRCGKAAVYTHGEFAECAEHAADIGSLANGSWNKGGVTGGAAIGDKVEIHRYGKTYIGTVVYVGARGRVEAEFTYDNGAVRRVAV